MSRRLHIATIADLFTIGFGIWSGFTIACVYTERSFDTFLEMLWLPAGGWLLVAFAILRKDSPHTAAESSHSESLVYTRAYLLLLALVGCLALLWYLEWIPGWIFWLGAISYLAAIMFPNGKALRLPSIGIAEPASRADAASILLVAVVAVVVTLAANRPDSDDSFYINVAVTTIERPELPMLKYDGLHSGTAVPLLQVAHRAQTYEILIAAASKLSAMEVLQLYYVIFPLFFACMFCVSQWLFLKFIDRDAAAVGLVVTFLIFLAWGEGHRTYGNFSFVRLYQGKAVFVCVFAPLLIYYALQFCRHATWRNWLLLMLAQLGAAGFTSSALVLGPICASLGLLSGAGISRRELAKVSAGVAASLPNAIILGMVAMEYLNAGSPVTGADFLTMRHVLGESLRSPLTLFGILCLPLLAIYWNCPSAGWLTRFVFLLFLLVFNKITILLLSELVAKNFSWRIFWTVPAPALLGAAVGLALTRGWKQWRVGGEPAGRILWIGGLLGCLLFFSAGRWSLSPANGVTFSWASAKIPEPDYRLARTVLSLTPPGGIVLAPKSVALILPRFPNPPKLILVRENYLDSLNRHWGAEETKKRKDLARFVAGKGDLIGLDQWVVAEIENRGVATVVCAKAVSERDDFRQGMIDSGFTRHSGEAYDIWFKRQPYG